MLLDGVFNHVGTDFARYRTSWFRKRGMVLHGRDFDTFEGHGELITLITTTPRSSTTPSTS